MSLSFLNRFILYISAYLVAVSSPMCAWLEKILSFLASKKCMCYFFLMLPTSCILRQNHPLFTFFLPETVWTSLPVTHRPIFFLTWRIPVTECSHFSYFFSSLVLSVWKKKKKKRRNILVLLLTSFSHYQMLIMPETGPSIGWTFASSISVSCFSVFLNLLLVL